MSICYTLASNEIEVESLCLYHEHCFLYLKSECSYVPFYVIREIQDYVDELHGVCFNDNKIGFLFERENPEEELSIQPYLDEDYSFEWDK